MTDLHGTILTLKPSRRLLPSFKQFFISFEFTELKSFVSVFLLYRTHRQVYRCYIASRLLFALGGRSGRIAFCRLFHDGIQSGFPSLTDLTLHP